MGLPSVIPGISELQNQHKHSLPRGVFYFVCSSSDEVWLSMILLGLIEEIYGKLQDGF